jgi:hypothetical protein
VDPTADAVGRAAFIKLPPLLDPLGRAGSLPGGLNFCFVRASPAAYPKGGGDFAPSRELVTQTNDGPISYSRLEIDKYGRVSSILFLTSDPLPDAWRFKMLILLPVTYLNDIIGRTDSMSIKCIRAFLLDDWAHALYHDRFHILREQLENAVQTSEHMSAVVSQLWSKVKAGDVFTSDVTSVDTNLAKDARLLVQDGLNMFLEANADLLPGYITSHRASDMQTNNVWGHTAQKVGLAVGDVPSMDDNI